MYISKECATIVGSNLTKMRTALGLSMKAMSELIGQTKDSNKLNLYEIGKRVTPLHVVIKAMEVTEIPMEDLYDVLFDPNYKLPKRYKPYANGTDDYERFLTDRRLQKRA
jgi:transcriptional regulator with XRE-family HTH domain